MQTVIKPLSWGLGASRGSPASPVTAGHAWAPTRGPGVSRPRLPLPTRFLQRPSAVGWRLCATAGLPSWPVGTARLARASVPGRGTVRAQPGLTEGPGPVRERRPQRCRALCPWVQRRSSCRGRVAKGLPGRWPGPTPPAGLEAAWPGASADRSAVWSPSASRPAEGQRGGEDCLAAVTGVGSCSPRHPLCSWAVQL